MARRLDAIADPPVVDDDTAGRQDDQIMLIRYVAEVACRVSVGLIALVYERGAVLEAESYGAGKVEDTSLAVITS